MPEVICPMNDAKYANVTGRREVSLWVSAGDKFLFGWGKARAVPFGEVCFGRLLKSGNWIGLL